VVDNDFDSGPSGVAVAYEHIIFTELDGTEGVLVDLNTRRYYQLNETAALIWRGFQRRAPSEEIAKEITKVYEVSDADAAASVRRLFRELLSRKLIRLA
jgi:Coenzyme PQQ synthesis protein D (PqqD)